MQVGTIGNYVKYAANVTFVAFASCLFLMVFLDTIGVDNSSGFNKFYLIWAVIAAVLHIFLLGTRQMEYAQHKEGVWEARVRKAGELSIHVVWGFLVSIAVLVALAIVVKAVLEINIIEMEYSYRLIFLTWAACSILLAVPISSRIMYRITT